VVGKEPQELDANHDSLITYGDATGDELL